MSDWFVFCLVPCVNATVFLNSVVLAIDMHLCGEGYIFVSHFLFFLIFFERFMHWFLFVLLCLLLAFCLSRFDLILLVVFFSFAFLLAMCNLVTLRHILLVFPFCFVKY